jgi:hypothetical protein
MRNKKLLWEKMRDAYWSIVDTSSPANPPEEAQWEKVCKVLADEIAPDLGALGIKGSHSSLLESIRFKILEGTNVDKYSKLVAKYMSFNEALDYSRWLGNSDLEGLILDEMDEIWDQMDSAERRKVNNLISILSAETPVEIS